MLSLRPAAAVFAGATMLFSLALGACGDGASDDGAGGSSGATGGTSVATAGTGGTSSPIGGSSGAATGGSLPGSGGTSSTGGSGGGQTRLDELMADAQERCGTLEMTVLVQFAEDQFAARLTGRVVKGSLAVEGSEEVLEQESILRHVVRLRWAANVANGAQVPVKGWVQQIRQSDPHRYRCFEGQVQVRDDRSGDLYYVFAADVVYEASADGSCGARTSEDEVVLGCVPDDY